MAVSQQALEFLSAAKKAEGKDSAAGVTWDLRGALPKSVQQKSFGKVLAAEDTARAFLAAQSAARERADAIIVGAAGPEDEPSVYSHIMLQGLLKPGGLMLVEAANELVVGMITKDMDFGLWSTCAPPAPEGMIAVKLSSSWSSLGMPTPSMCGGTVSEPAADEAVGLRQRKPAIADTATVPVVAAPAPAANATPTQETPGPFAARLRSLMALMCLWAFAPFLVLWAFAAWARHRILGPSFTPGKPKRKLKVLVTGGKMSKASAVARAVGRDGHEVYTAEIMPYKFCHTRFCTYVSKHYVLPRPTVQPKEWEATIQNIVATHGIDLIIPCTAPVESSAYAHLRESLPPNVRVFAFDGDTSDELDNKYTFNQVLVKAGLPCPQTANMECLEDAVRFFETRPAPGSSEDDGKRFIVKPAVYDPKARTEILFLPIADRKRQLEYLKSRNATKEVPYVIQEVLKEPEYGSFAMFSNGALTGFEFFASAASCLVYRQLRTGHYNAVLELNKGLGKAMNLTGQLTLDLMHTATNELVPIECNPRIHSAVCTLEGHRNLGSAFTEPNFVPKSDSEIAASKPETFRYWVMDQIFLMAGFWKPKNCFKLSVREMMTGTDAILAGDDPMPFLTMYLAQIPSLLVLELIAGTPWLKIDFCIGKIVKEGGD